MTKWTFEIVMRDFVAALVEIGASCETAARLAAPFDVAVRNEVEKAVAEARARRPAEERRRALEEVLAVVHRTPPAVDPHDMARRLFTTEMALNGQHNISFGGEVVRRCDHGGQARSFVDQNAAPIQGAIEAAVAAERTKILVEVENAFDKLAPRSCAVPFITLARKRAELWACPNCCAVRSGTATYCRADPEHNAWREAVDALEETEHALRAISVATGSPRRTIERALFKQPKWIPHWMAAELARAVEPGSYLVRREDDWQFCGSYEEPEGGALDTARKILAERGLRAFADGFGIRVEPVDPTPNDQTRDDDSSKEGA